MVRSLSKSSEYEADPDFIRCICWTNRAVVSQYRIRKAIYGHRDAFCGEEAANIHQASFYKW